MRHAAAASALAVAALALLAAPRPAAADGSYFTMGFGPGDVGSELRDHSATSFRIRAGAGHRIGNIAVEGFVAGDIFDDYRISDASTVGLDLKYILPLSSHFQAYVRGSASRMSTTIGDGYPTNDCYSCGGGYYYDGRDYAGRGLGAGAGLQLRGKVRAIGFLYWPLFFVPAGPKVNAAFYVDHGYDFYRLHPADGRGGTIDAKLYRWTFGFNVGKDF
ncbi:MAG: hypothetical protein K8M05_03595 [Deltaproteobacteria bacterium]|nr:hypothetical protein [Kofleriaceae bacterium]